MATRSDELTQEIDATRGRMDRTIDQIGERAGPGRLTERMRGAVESTRDTVMGTAADVREGAADGAGEAVGALRSRSQGNPLAAGLVAFGAGLLAGSVMPESRTENRLAREVQRSAQAPLRDNLQDSVSAVADRLGERVEAAKEQVADEAVDAKDEVVGDARSRARDVQDHARDAADEVRQDVADTARHHTGS